MENNNHEQEGIFVEFMDISKINNSEVYKLEEGILYEVVNYDLQGVPTILLEDGKTFSLLKKEMQYIEFHEHFDIDPDIYFEESYTPYMDYLNFNPFNMDKSKNTKAKKYDYLNDLSNSVKPGECDSLIKELETMNSDNELTRLVKLKDFEGLEKLRIIISELNT